MSFKLLGGGSDLGTVVNDVNQNILELKNREVTEIFKDDNGTPVVILDKNGLRTTAPGGGIDVTSATNAQYTFNSGQNVFKIVDKVTLPAQSFTTVTAAVGQYNFDVQVFDIFHSYGYAPIVLAFQQFSGEYLPLPSTVYNGNNTRITTINTEIYSLLDRFQVQIFSLLNNTVGATPYNISITSSPILIYVLQESAQQV